MTDTTLRRNDHVTEKQHMRKLIRRSLILAGAMATTIALAAVPASAVSFSASGIGNLVFASSSGGVVVCTSSSLTGDARIGPVPLGTSLIDIATASFSLCTMSGQPANVTSLNTPWAFIVDSYSGGVSNGHLTGAELLLNLPALSCTVVINSPGDVSGTYTNPPGILQLEDYNLAVSNSTCPPNTFTTGDSVVFFAKYQF